MNLLMKNSNMKRKLETLFNVLWIGIPHRFMNFSGQEISNHFWEIFMKIEFEKINKGRVKIEFSQAGVKVSEFLFRIIL
jgi:hypothetical protein